MTLSPLCPRHMPDQYSLRHPPPTVLPALSGFVTRAEMFLQLFLKPKQRCPRVPVRSLSLARHCRYLHSSHLKMAPLFPSNVSKIGCPTNALYGYGLQISFSWTDGNAPGVAGYEIFVKHSGSINPLLDVSVQSTQYVYTSCNATVADPNLKDWQWRVRAKDASGNFGDWSGTRTFQFAPCRFPDGRICGYPATALSGSGWFTRSEMGKHWLRPVMLAFASAYAAFATERTNRSDSARTGRLRKKRWEGFVGSDEMEGTARANSAETSGLGHSHSQMARAVLRELGRSLSLWERAGRSAG